MSAMKNNTATKATTAKTGTTQTTEDTTSTATKATIQTPEAVSLVDTKTGEDGSTMTPSTDSIPATTKTGTTQTAEDVTSTPGTQTPEKTRKTTEATPDITSTPGENSTGDAKTTEDVIYHVLGVNGKDKAYLVHIDPDVFAGTDWTYQRIEIAVTGTNHVTVTAPEHYDGEITDEVVVSLDADRQLCIAGIPVTPDAQTDEADTGALAPDYLSEGYYKGEGKNRYPNPVLVDQAETIGKSLAAGGVTATAFNRLLRTLKTAKNKPFDAQEGALKKLIPQVIDLENKKKAPPLLREIVERNRTEVQNAADFAACLDHFKDIATFLAAAQK